MKILKYNREQIQNEFKTCANLSEAINQIESSTAAEDSLLCRITVNDVVFEEKDEQNYRNTPISDIRSLSIEVESRKTLIKDSLNSAREYVEQMIEQCLQIADEVRTGKATTQRVMGLVSALESIVEIVTLSVKSAGGKIEIKETDWAFAVGELLRSLRELLSAVETGDTVLTADVVEYELSQALGLWLNIVRA